ncbi:hypothetical protein H2201_003591 [Coniosporium apollinis]|uniref:Uncharacterized protein n=1 Tax=Coniosporium apollinis TaxID=61459 RepID=A0ABQ9NWR7_9PEZI|nr:hypothetical protein H2201_003591 [Coniosporium apollinis]
MVTQSFFEHHFNFFSANLAVNANSGSTDRPTHLEFAAGNYEYDAFLLLLRHKRGDSSSASTKCLRFLKEYDQLKHTPLHLAAVRAYLQEHENILTRHPLLIINVVLSMLQARAQEYVRWRQELYSIEARLGITRNLDGLRRSLYPDVDYDFTGLNADLAGIARMIIDNELSASTILEHAEALQRVVAICEKYERAAAVPARNSPAGAAWEESFVTSEQFEEINSTITRAKLCLKHVKMTQDVLQSLTAALYNRINKQDTQSMETIAVVTLLFLPATFVSAIFSTGIFRFHAGEADGNGRVISRFGWIYLMLCLLLTSLTLVGGWCGTCGEECGWIG